MKVSVIIPAFNEAARIEFSVQQAWTAGADEVIVADGESTDGTAEIVRSLPCTSIRVPPGRARQQNAAAAIAAHDVLLFLHADNWLPTSGVEQIRQVLADDRVQHGAFRQRIDADGAAFRAIEWGNSQRVRWLGIPYGDQGLFVRRDPFRKCGGFPDVMLMEDVQLAKKLRRVRWPVLLPGPLHVDPRRWQRYGVIRQTLRNWSLLTAFTLGVHPDRLARHYRRHDGMSS